MNRVLREVRRLLGALLLTLLGGAGAAWAEAVAEPPLPDGLYAEITTPRGTFTAELFFQKTPLAVTSFVGLAEGVLGPRPGQPFFDGLVFHRVVPDFVVQGGDPLGRGEGGPGYTFPDEFVPGLSHDAAGVLAMANNGPDANGSQFFVTLAPAVRLDYLHTVFGRVVRGLKVLPRIRVDDPMQVRIRRLGTAAGEFRVEPAAFTQMIAHTFARRAPLPAGGRPAYFEDPAQLLPTEPPRTRAFNFKLAAFERVTGRRICVRLLAKSPPGAEGRKLENYVKTVAAELGLAHDGILLVYIAGRDEWKLWLGDALLPEILGRPGTLEEVTRERALEKKKDELLAPAKARLSDRSDPEQSAAQRLKLACDEALAALMATLTPPAPVEPLSPPAAR